MFLACMLKALQTVLPDFGNELIDLLQTARTIQVEVIVSQMINELADRNRKMVLVLDDYHTLDSKPVDDILAFLPGRMPPQMHIVITTREDPRVQLARLRACGDLNELTCASGRYVDILAHWRYTGGGSPSA